MRDRSRTIIDEACNSVILSVIDDRFLFCHTSILNVMCPGGFDAANIEVI